MNKLIYMAPELELIEMEVEQGFLASLTSDGPNYVDGGEGQEDE